MTQSFRQATTIIPGGRSPTQQWYWPIGVLTLASFGPYILPELGLRTEQIIVYPLAILAGLRLSRGGFPRSAFLVGLAWLCLFSVVAIGGLFACGSDNGHVPNCWSNYLAGLDNFALPFAVGIVALYWLRRWGRREVLYSVSAWYTLLLSANAVLIIASLVNEMSWLTLFWSPNPSPSVAQRAAELGRSSGVFNQPLEAGVAYSLGLLLLVYRSDQTRSLQIALISALLLIGGVVSSSKIFLLLGVPTALAYFLYAQRPHFKYVVGGVILGAGGLWLMVSNVIGWVGPEYLRALFLEHGGGHSLLYQFSGGRYGELGTLQHVVDRVLTEAPVLGFGAPGIPVAYDSAYVQALIVGGIVGLLLYILALTVLAARWLRVRNTLLRPERGLTFAAMLLAVAAGVGGPTLTANRAGVPLVLVLVTGLLTWGKSTCNEASPRRIEACSGSARRLSGGRMARPFMGT